MTQAINEGLHGRIKRRQAVWSALAIAVLALVSPATAMGAQGRVRPQLTTTRATGATARADRESMPGARLGRSLLALGSGYGIHDGSPLVRDLQRRLAAAGYPAGRVDGLFGSQTFRAVVAFQASHGLRVDGVVGPRTRAALSAPELVLGPGARDQPGGSGAVRSLQLALARAGDLPGPIDGRFGALTGRAVRRFQSAHRLPADGMAGARTLALLGASLSHRLAIPHKPAVPRKPAVPHTLALPQKRAAPHETATPMTVSHGSGRPTGSGAVPWVTVVGGLALVLALILAAPLMAGAVRRARRRHEDDTVATPAKIPANPVVLDETPVATVRGADQPVATDRGNDRPVADMLAEAASAFDLGVRLEAQGSLAEAQATYGRADERGHGGAAASLGRLLEEQGALAEAEAAYRRADERGDGAGAFSLGVLLEERGAVEEAEAAYRRAADRGHDAAATNLGVLLEEHGELDEAEAAYRRAVEDGAAAASFNLGVLLEERGDLTGAEEAYRRAEERGDTDVANMARAALLDLREAAPTAGAGRAGGPHHA